MPVVLILLIALLALSLGVAMHAALADRDRRVVLGRVLPSGAESVFAAKRRGARSRVTRWLARSMPTSNGKPDAAGTLVRAGFDGPVAAAVYGVTRTGAVVAATTLTLVVAPRHTVTGFLALLALSVVIGLLAPPAILARLVRRRQSALRRALPDALDLLVVCVEAGISLDAAIVRVAREMMPLHPGLAGELMIVNRKVNAGLTREAALHGLSDRTGLDELRALAANMIQSERWGTSIATVLRVYAEALRRRRRQAAERHAATAPLKMLFPLGIFIFPAIFVVIVGPAFLKILTVFRH
jgi:tight adherence protein C